MNEGAYRNYLLAVLLVIYAFNSVDRVTIIALTTALWSMRMRATSIALMYLFANLIGMGLGPLAAGALSDALRPWAGEESLRYALLALSPGYAWGGWHLWRASRAIP